MTYKTIYLRVQVPDHINPETVDIGYISHDNFNDYRAEFTEIQFPSEEEIESKAKSVTRNEFGLKGFKKGATWLLNKLKGE